MPPFARLILRGLRIGAIMCGVCVALFLAIHIWLRWLASAGGALGFGDYAFMALLVLLLLGCAYLSRAIGRELRR